MNRPAWSRHAAADWLALLLVALVLAGGAPGGAGPPQLIVDESVAADFEALAQETWARFLAALAARSDCWGDVHLRASRDLHSRAAYDPATATVTVRVPATAAMLQGALVHEWAHHVEFQCAAHAELVPAFLAAQGLPPDTPWRPETLPAEIPTSAWASIPSEQYAEAMIVFVFGQRQIPTRVRLAEEAVGVLAEWAAGGVPAETRGD